MTEYDVPEEHAEQPMSDREHVRELRREALWKWRWLGFANSTPAFKVSLVVLALAGCALVVTAVVA